LVYAANHAAVENDSFVGPLHLDDKLLLSDIGGIIDIKI